MDSSLLKRLSGNATVITFLVSGLIGLVLGILGPFGSYQNGNLFERLAYWLVSLWGCWAIFALSVPRLARLAHRHRLPIWFWWPLCIVGLALPAAIYTRLIASVFWPFITRVGWLEWYAQSIAISAMATLAMMWLMRSTGAPGKTLSAPGQASESADPRDRLPPTLGRHVICLQMEDHYVRVHTLKGSALVLMSLSQAMDGLKDLEGQKVHRSWWVARSAISGVVEDGRNVRLKLTGGLQAPVSRAHVGRLRAQGWL